MDRLTRIDAQWETFARASFSPDMPKQQRIDLRRTFFGGVAAFIAAVYASPEGEPEEQLLSDIQAEMLTFVEDVKAGRA